MAGKNTDRFADQIIEISRRSAAIPKKLEIDLAVALIDQPYDLSGNMFYVFSAPDEQSYVDIKVNETREPAISFSVHTGLITPFDRLLITTPAAQTGTLILLYGTESPDLLQVLDHRSVTVAGVGGVLEELRGDLTPENYTGVTVGVAAGVVLAANVGRKACIIQALSTNANNIFLGFTNAVTVGGAPGTWFAELAPGQAFAVDDYRGDIYGISAGAAQVVGVGEW